MLGALLGSSAIEVVLYGAKGFYRTRYADVQSWTGYVEVEGCTAYNVGSWDTMTDCLRGFEVIDHRSGPFSDRRYSDFEVMATTKAPKNKPMTRWNG